LLEGHPGFVDLFTCGAKDELASEIKEDLGLKTHVG
jgi:hypothetical protein